MANLCDIAFIRAGFTYRCDRPYAHPGNCEAAGIQRISLSPVAQRRYEERQKKEAEEAAAQAVIPPEESKVLDPYVDYVKILENKFPNAVFQVSFDSTHREPQLFANGAKLLLPMYLLRCFDTCCGVYNLDGWLCDSTRIVDPLVLMVDRVYRDDVIAAFCYWLEYQKRHNPIMGFVSTTNQYQGAAMKLLERCGFSYVEGLNGNSGRRVRIWTYNLKPVE